MRRSDEVIGIIPCGGHATRISPLPCSKEILPAGLRGGPGGALRPKVVSHYLLENMRDGGVAKVFLVLRKGKWDIPEYYGNGEWLGLHLGYLVVQVPYGPAYTLDEAYPFVRGVRVAIGFPDILIGPRDAYQRAFQRLASTKADFVLGTFPARDPRVMDMIDLDRNGRVRELVIKPEMTDLRTTWMFAVWGPAFTEYLHEYLRAPRTSLQQPGNGLPPELSVGHVLQAAVRDGLVAQSVAFAQDDYLDIGTSEGLSKMLSQNRVDQEVPPPPPASGSKTGRNRNRARQQ